jgi:hypothetical protein
MPPETESTTPPAIKPPDSPTKIHPVVDFLWKEWRVIKSPSFWIAIGIASIGLFFIEQWHYTGTIAEKDATIQAQVATIGDVDFLKEEMGALTNAFNIGQSTISNDENIISSLNFRLNTNATALANLAYYEDGYSKAMNPDFRWEPYNNWAMADFDRADYQSAAQNFKMAFDLEAELRHTDEAKTIFFPLYETAKLMVNTNASDQFHTNLDSIINEIAEAQKQHPVSSYEYFDKRSALHATVENLIEIKPIVAQVQKSNGEYIAKIIESAEALEKSAHDTNDYVP